VRRSRDDDTPTFVAVAIARLTHPFARTLAAYAIDAVAAVAGIVAIAARAKCRISAAMTSSTKPGATLLGGVAGGVERTRRQAAPRVTVRRRGTVGV
jgi:hypothetical protein